MISEACSNRLFTRRSSGARPCRALPLGHATSQLMALRRWSRKRSRTVNFWSFRLLQSLAKLLNLKWMSRKRQEAKPLVAIEIVDPPQGVSLRVPVNNAQTLKESMTHIQLPLCSLLISTRKKKKSANNTTGFAAYKINLLLSFSVSFSLCILYK